jgi:hypothetical protein
VIVASLGSEPKGTFDRLAASYPHSSPQKWIIWAIEPASRRFRIEIREGHRLKNNPAVGRGCLEPNFSPRRKPFTFAVDQFNLEISPLDDLRDRTQDE